MKDTQLPNTPQPALIFIPDISGFTSFVAEVETNHARHIIEELLETIIDANDIGMEVSEVEGDAILFYRFGTAPTAAELLAQVQKMFVRFHGHLKKYETHRICNCGACRTANNLSLKFVAHYGDISVNTIKQYKKLFGKDVIIAHRLLKNSIDGDEYALVTHPLVQACPQWVHIDTVAWAPLQNAQETYDSGMIDYCFLPLEPLSKHVPDPVVEDYSIPGVKTRVMETEAVIDAPLEMVFNIVSDVAWRNQWTPGALPEVVDINSSLTQTGQTHRCLINGPTMVGHNFSVSEDIITYTETDVGKTRSGVYVLTRLPENRTSVHVTLFLKKHPIMPLIFRLLLKKKVFNVYRRSFENLNAYCKELLASGKEHPFWVMLKPEQAAVQTA